MKHELCFNMFAESGIHWHTHWHTPTQTPTETYTQEDPSGKQVERWPIAARWLAKIRATRPPHLYAIE